MDYKKILKILDIDSDISNYLDKRRNKFYIIKKEFDEYGKEVVNFFLKEDYMEYYRDIDKFYNDYKKYGRDIISLFYSNFIKYYINIDKFYNDYKKYGKDIVSLFCNNFIKYYENIDKFYNDYKKYGIKIISDFIEDEGYKIFDIIDNYIKEKEILRKYNEFYKNKYKHKILYEKFKEGIIFTNEELEYFKSKRILDKFNDDEIELFYFNIDDLRKINKLFPSRIKKFICKGNKYLKDLKGSPNEAEEYDCSNCKLISLEGSPKKVKIFNCSFNYYLKDLKYGPEEAEKYYCYECGLISLEGSPKKVKIFNCNGNKNLIDLKGGPEEAEEEYNCSNCRLTNLEGAPRKVKVFNCSFNNSIFSKKVGLKNLIGGPEEVEGEYDCSFCNLESLEGLAKRIGVLKCGGNKFDKEYVEKFIKENNIEVKEIIM